MLLVNNNKLSDNLEENLTGYEYYTVIKGDTLYSIARKFGITVDALKKLNNLISNTLNIGQKLIVGQTISSNLYTVKRGDTLFAIARMYGLTVNDIINANSLKSNVLSIGQTLIIPSKDSLSNVNTRIYIVKKGDTLYQIAKNYNVSVNELKNLNNLSSNVLSIGQKLIIPS